MPTASLAQIARPSWQLLKSLATVKPKEPKVTVGLDIGSSAVKAIALGPRRGLRPRTILGQHRVALDPSSESQVAPAIREALGALHTDVKGVTISVGGQWVIMRVVEMPPMKTHELLQALPIEAQRHLPFNVQDVMLDGAVLGPATNGKVWVLIVACKRELLERRITWVQQAGFLPICVDVDALALANAFVEHGGGRKRNAVHALVDVGAQRTSLVVLRGEVPYLVRDIPWGSVKLMRQLTEQLSLDEEAIKKQLAKDGTPSTEFLDALKRIVESLTVDLQLSFDFFENRFGPPPEQLSITGGLSGYPVFVEALKGGFAQPVGAWSPVPGLAAEFTVAYGLALRTVPA